MFGIKKIIDSITANSLVEVNDIVTVSKNTDSNKFICSQIMMANGPRKERVENEIGEDCGGVISYYNKGYGWIIDGTSEEQKIKIFSEEYNEYTQIFSSRYLAKLLSSTLQELLTPQSNILWVFEEVLKEVQIILQKGVSNLHEPQKEKLKEIIKNGRVIISSVTFSLASLDFNMNANLIRIGDTNAFFLNDKGDLLPINKKDAASSRLTYNIKIIQDELSVRFTIPNFDSFTGENIKMITHFSDGFSKNSKILFNALEDIKNLRDVKCEILKYFEKTNDDKSINLISLNES